MKKLSEYEKQANSFAKKHGITMKVLKSRFGSMDWDKDQQERYIHTIELSRNNKTYSFEFGSSVADSCLNGSEWDNLNNADKIDFYAGLKSVNGKNISASISFSFSKQSAENIDDTRLTALVNELKKEYDYQANKNNKAIHEKFDLGYISKNDRDSKLIGGVKEGVIYQTIQNSIKRKIDELKKESTYSKNVPNPKVPAPSMYDVLTCLTKYDPEGFEDFCSNFGYDTDSRGAERTYNAVVEEWANVEILFGDILEELQEIQ